MNPKAHTGLIRITRIHFQLQSTLNATKAEQKSAKVIRFRYV